LQPSFKAPIADDISVAEPNEQLGRFAGSPKEPSVDHKIVAREECIEARKALLAKEKEWTRLREPA
jgi:hypothetical protein